MIKIRTMTRLSAQNLRQKLLENPLKNDSRQQKLLINLNGSDAFVLYEKYGNVYHLVHTSVPKEIRGHGLGHILAQRVFDYIAENNLKMKIVCEFLAEAVQNNLSKYSKHIVQ